MADRDLVRRACETAFGFAALGCERFEAHAAAFIRSEIAPTRHNANHVGLVRTSDADVIEALLAYARSSYEGPNRPRFNLDALTPPQVAARLILEGFNSEEFLYIILEGNLQARSKPDINIREVTTDADWQAYIDLDLIWWQDLAWTRDANLVEQNYAFERLKMPAAHYRCAYVDGGARAFLSAWPGENGIGMIEYLFTHPDYRHRGLATALIAHCVADARERGAGPIVIGTEVGDTPKQMYAALGFRPLMVNRVYFPPVVA